MTKTPLYESFSWLQDTKEAILDTKDPKAVRFKFVFAHANEVSKNGRKYLDEELQKATRTLIGKRINLNHDNNIIVGHIPWAEYENGRGEAIGEVTKQPYVDLIRNGSTKIQGVSMQANFLKCQCSRCGKKFDSEPQLREHIKIDEVGMNADNQPRGLVFSDPGMALVLSPQTPGCDTSLELMETHHGWLNLVETVVEAHGGAEAAAHEREWLLSLRSNGEKQSMLKAPVSYETRQSSTVVHELEKPGKPAKEEAPKQTKEDMCPVCKKPLTKDGECTNKECSKFTGKKDEAPPLKEEEKATAPKITVEAKTDKPQTVTIKEAFTAPKLAAPKFAEPKFSITEVQSGKAQEKIEEQRQIIEAFGEAVNRINALQEYLSQPFTVTADDLSWQKQLSRSTESVNAGFEALTVSLNKIPVYNDTPLREIIAALPKDDLGWKEIKPYDDKAIREAIAAIPKDDLSWKEALAALPKDDTTWVTRVTELENQFKQAHENSTKQATQNSELSATVKVLQGETTTLKETFAKTKADFEKLLELADKNITETKRTLEQRVADMQKTNETQSKELQSAKETIVKAQNDYDKLKATFKGKAEPLKETSNQPIMKDPITEAN